MATANLIDPELMHTVVTDNLEQWVTCEGPWVESADFSCTRTSGKIVWRTFNFPVRTKLTSQLFVIGLSMGGFKPLTTGDFGPTSADEGDTLKLTYTVFWNAGLEQRVREATRRFGQPSPQLIAEFTDSFTVAA